MESLPLLSIRIMLTGPKNKNTNRILITSVPNATTATNVGSPSETVNKTAYISENASHF